MCASMRAWRVLPALLVWSIAMGASAQTSAPGDARAGLAPPPAAPSRPLAAGAQAPRDVTKTDTRTQYPLFLSNAYFTASVGSIRYPFSERQLEPGFHAQTIEIPHLAARVDLFGRRLVDHLSAEVTYIRPARFVAYDNVNGDHARSQVSAAIGGILLVSDAPVTRRLSVYGEGGLGITSRSAVEIDGRTALRAAHYSAGLLGAGFIVHATANVDLVVGATYSPGRKSLSQPSTRLFTTGFRYRMRPLPASTVAENRRAGFAFPANVVRLGYTSNLLGYGVNNVFTSDVPIFWGGHILTKRGLTLDYQHNVFHTKKRFAFDLGASASVLDEPRQPRGVPDALRVSTAAVLPAPDRAGRRLRDLLARRADLSDAERHRRSRHRRPVHLPGLHGGGHVPREGPAHRRRAGHQALLERQHLHAQRRDQDSPDVDARPHVLRDASVPRRYS